MEEVWQEDGQESSKSKVSNNKNSYIINIAHFLIMNKYYSYSLTYHYEIIEL